MSQNRAVIEIVAEKLGPPAPSSWSLVGLLAETHSLGAQHTDHARRCASEKIDPVIEYFAFVMARSRSQ
jgi:hypothetical protein